MMKGGNIYLDASQSLIGKPEIAEFFKANTQQSLTHSKNLSVIKSIILKYNIVFVWFDNNS
jgi:hypothetical protein